MIKVLIMFFMVLTASFGSTERISNINTIRARVSETVYLNGEKKNKEYSIEYSSPDYLRKEILSPNINKGEIFQYENNKRYVYIPIFNEITEEAGTDEVNNFLNIIKDLKKKDLESKSFRDQYYKKEVKTLALDQKVKIRIKDYKIIDNFLFPSKMEIYDGDSKVADIELKDTRINLNLKRKELKVKK